MNPTQENVEVYRVYFKNGRVRLFSDRLLDLWLSQPGNHLQFVTRIERLT